MKPAPRSQRSTRTKRERPTEESCEEQSNGEGGRGVFEVEEILEHEKRKDGKVWYLVKWRGYVDKDNTWEPEEHFKDTGTDILAEYYEPIYGKHMIEESRRVVKTKKRLLTADGTSGTEGKRRQITKSNKYDADETWPMKAEEWRPPLGSWEDDIKTIDGCDKDNAGHLAFYVTWNTGKKTKHGTETIYKRCPQMILRYYEKHARIPIREEKTMGDSPKGWRPPLGPWEKEIERIDDLDKDDAGRLTVHVTWNTRKKTKHDTKTIYKKCPQTMLRFYEKHVVLHDEHVAGPPNEALV
ncbi:Chromodomain Y-like protein [Fusarium oxysporum f. sp. rapae]|uniref:Chromodomain Y-like protein n=1 Tax=Fusarium oxysporum f. sp. rapae TaxID=485398 RepID=A0A8J5NFW1_FUSOX|nr:Chromodomain Y-like protein [Fusarium oxysporum f. sp. rapae]KAG7402549.1 Chromodomain Y-like protein [Fusarium oxysporum f. sp. rapae]KAG7402692.1 Chromodomain Y-like protein [Fusarium oxysporum f. sp. rapae]